MLTGSVLGNDTDIDGDTLSVNNTPIIDPANGSVLLNTDGTFTYTPDLNFFGTDSFTYEVVTATVEPTRPWPTSLSDQSMMRRHLLHK